MTIDLNTNPRVRQSRLRNVWDYDGPFMELRLARREKKGSAERKNGKVNGLQRDIRTEGGRFGIRSYPLAGPIGCSLTTKFILFLFCYLLARHAVAYVYRLVGERATDKISLYSASAASTSLTLNVQ